MEGGEGGYLFGDGDDADLKVWVVHLNSCLDKGSCWCCLYDMESHCLCHLDLAALTSPHTLSDCAWEINLVLSHIDMSCCRSISSCIAVLALLGCFKWGYICVCTYFLWAFGVNLMVRTPLTIYQYQWDTFVIIGRWMTFYLDVVNSYHFSSLLFWAVVIRHSDLDRMSSDKGESKYCELKVVFSQNHFLLQCSLMKLVC